MICNSCGTQNPAGSEFCSNCGQKVSAAKPVQSPAKSAAPAVKKAKAPDKPAEVSPLEEYRSKFRVSWRNMVSSPLGLVLILVFGAFVFVGFFEINTVFNDLSTGNTDVKMYDAILYLFQVFGMKSLAHVDSLLSTLQVFCVMPGVIIAVGLGMIYADSRYPSKTYINTVGFSLIQGVMIALLSVLGIIMLGVIYSGFTVVFDVGVKEYMTSRMDLVSSLFLLAVVVAVLGGICFFAVGLLRGMKNTAEGYAPDHDCVMGMIVLSALAAGVIVIMMISSGSASLFSLLSLVFCVLCGIALYFYKGFLSKMEVMYYDARRNSWDSKETKEVKKPASNGIPAWKRVEMLISEQNNPDRT